MVDYSPSSPSGATTSYAYDASSNLTSVTQSNNMSISYAYNTNNEVNCIGYPIPGTSTAGACANAPSPANPVVLRHHNADGQLVSVEDFFGTVTSFGYGARGSLTSITYPSATGSSITYAYDQALNMTNENTTAPGQPTGTGDETWAYNADELRSGEYLNGSSTPSYSWSYNSRLMVTSNATTSFSYHNNGAIISSSSSQASTTFASTSWNSNGTQLCWSINTLVSSPSCSSPPIGATDYSYTSDGQLTNIEPTSSSQASATASYAWDPLGHMCWWSAPSYVSSPTCSSPPSGATSYTYSGSGLRMSETPPGGQVDNFAYDTATASVPAIIEDSTNAYIYGPQNTPIEQVPLSSLASSTPVIDFIASDPTGMREISSFQMASGAPVLLGYEMCSYTTYGTQSCSSSGTTPPSTPIGYEDGYTDPSGLVYLINRYYDPSLRQFISVDPAYSQTHQLYGYANENPVNGSDPSGMLSLFGTPICFITCPAPPPKWVHVKTSQYTGTVYGPFYRSVKSGCTARTVMIELWSLYQNNANGTIAMLTRLQEQFIPGAHLSSNCGGVTATLRAFLCNIGRAFSASYYGNIAGGKTPELSKVFEQAGEQSLAWYAVHSNSVLLHIGQAALNMYKNILKKWANGEYVS